MKVLVIGTLYEPDQGPSAGLFTLLSKNLVKRGHQVTVITMVPHYPSGQVRTDFQGKWLWRSTESGVRVIRVGIPSADRSNLFRRFSQYICYQIGAVWAGLFEEYDVVLAANPFLTVFLPFVWFATLRRKPAVYSVHDIYPDVGIELGIFRSNVVIRAAGWLESYCLKRARRVRILAKSFAPILSKQGVPQSKLELIYDWVDVEVVRPLPRENGFAAEYDLTDCFVALYAGNIGLVQGLDAVVEAAGLLENDPEICFVFVGDGAGREALAEKTCQLGLRNVRFIPYQPRERMPEVFATADVSLVTLRKGTSLGALPSKTYHILSSGRPVIVSVDEGSDTWDLVKRADAGLCVPAENPSQLAKAVLTLKQDPDLRERLGCNGRIWAEQHHSPQSAAAQFESILLAARSTKKAV